MFKKSKLTLAVLSALGAASTIAIPVSVQAQQTQASASTDTITVTARRREELIQDVPGAVSAFSGEALDKAGVDDILGIADLVPNTTLKASRGTNTTLTAFIRGVGQQDPVAGYEPGVGVYLDDVYLARPQGAVMDIYDVQRVEVLRGPQGTLYGRNTIGGAVKYVTRRLGVKPELRANVTLGQYGQRDFSLTGSAAASDALRFGATLASFDRDGYGENVVNGKPNYDKDVMAARVSAELIPNSKFSVRFAADKTIDKSNAKQGHRLTVGKVSGAPILSDVYNTRANLYAVNGQSQKVTNWGQSVTMEYELNDTTVLKSITARRGSKSFAPIDFDSLNSVDLDVPAIYSDNQTSQEFQLNYTTKTWQVVAGVYYLSANAFNEFDVILPSFGGFSVYTRGDIDTKAWAAFADASYQMTKEVDISFGGRYTRDTRQAEVFRANYFGLGSPTLGNPNAALFRVDTNLGKDVLDRTDSKFTPKAGLGYKLNPNQKAYFTYSEGFKGGMFDPRMNLGGNPNNPAVEQLVKGVDPEIVKTIELGLKSASADKTLQTNVAVFSSQYRDVQVPGSVAIDTNGDGVDDSFAGTLTNAGKARIRGVELEAIARVTPQFSVTGMVGLIDAEYTEWIVNGVNVAASRNFQNTPERSANLTATYDMPMSFMGRSGTLSFINSLSYKSKTYQFETPAPELDQDAYSLWDLGVVWTSNDRKTRVGLHGKNLSDERYKVAGYYFPTLGNEGSITAFYGAPRTVSVSLEQRF